MLVNINKTNFGKEDILNQVYMLFDEVNDVEAKNICEWIISANHAPMEERPDVLTLFINSGGGSINAAWAIIDCMRGSSIPVRTIGLGGIASAGVLIFMAGEKGMRFLTEHTSVMTHQFGWGTIGKYHELMSSTVEYTNIQKRLLDFMSKCTGLTKEDVQTKLMPSSDVWLTAKEALSLGICDAVKSLK